jgi:hypothetical protein
MKCFGMMSSESACGTVEVPPKNSCHHEKEEGAHHRGGQFATRVRV